MSYYSPVANIKLISELNKQGALDPYILVLAHEVLAAPDDFNIFRDEFEGTIILDNSLIELGHAMPVHQMAEAHKICGADYVVLPDKLRDRHTTVNLVLQAAHSWKLIDYTGKFMIVAQGETTEECHKCIADIMDSDIFYNASPEDIIVGIPRVLGVGEGTRARLIESISEYNFPIHLLGMSDSFADDMDCAKMPGVLGIDSATPIRLGWEDKMIDAAAFDTFVPRIDLTHGLKDRELFFRECIEINDSIAYNIEAIRKHLGA